MTPHSHHKLLEELIQLPDETEWVEFKVNNEDPRLIGEQLSALANSAALHNQDRGFLVWGIEDKTHAVVGTTFTPRSKKVQNQELENWLTTQLNPRTQFWIRELDFEGRRCVIFEVEPASHRPVDFKGKEWVRVGSYKKPLREHPEKEKILWRLFTRESFESGIALRGVPQGRVLELIDYPSYFELSGQPLPADRAALLESLVREHLVSRSDASNFDITNLGAALFAKDLEQFPGLSRSAVRVIFYKEKNRTQTVKEFEGKKGYASGFSGLVAFIRDRLPSSEVIREALRENLPQYPEIAIRELVANALIHQDFDALGTGPMVEIFSDRIEITNPGAPLIDVERFLDLPPRSRNEKLSKLMRRLKICEERGSGIDKVLVSVESYQLPPPKFEALGGHTKAILYAPREFSKMTKAERVRACYQHAGLQHVSNEVMTNTSLRKRFSILDKNYATASRIISDTLTLGLIKPSDPSSTSKRHASYLPFWA